MEYFVAIGGNLGDSLKIFESAFNQVTENIGKVVLRSDYIETPPLLHPLYPTYGQNNYINGVFSVESKLAPLETLKALLKIETNHGRDRSVDAIPWGPRSLDLDLIACGDAIINLPELVLPHPRMHQRLFVLEPLNQIAPDWKHPILNLTAKELLLRVGN